MRKSKIIRTATVAISIDKLLEGQLKYLSNFYDVIGLSSYDPVLDKVKKREGVRIIDVAIERRVSIHNDLKSLCKLYYKFKEESPLIVHSITPKAGLLSMVAAKLAGVPIRIHTFTGLIFPSKKGIFKMILILMDKVLCLCATNIYPEGLGVKNDLIGNKITSKPLKILANGNINGVNLEYFNPNLFPTEDNLDLRKSLEIKENDLVFIFVGRLVRDKGINELVNVFDRLSKENSSVKLLLVGSFEENLDALKEETMYLIEYNDKIISVGYQQDVRPYFAISDVLTFPSYREGFPNVVLQAGAMNLFSIVSDISGCNEIIEDGVNGIIIPIKDTSSLYKAMKKTLVSKEEFQKPRKIIAEKYEQSIVWNALLAEYKLLEDNV